MIENQNWVTGVVAAVCFTGGLLSGLQCAGVIAAVAYVIGMGLIFITLIGGLLVDHARQLAYQTEERRKLAEYARLDRRMSTSIIRLEPRSAALTQEAAE